MAEVKLYIDGQMILPEVGKDMLSMVGWSDTEETKYCSKEKGQFIPLPIRLDSDTYLGYFGDEDVTLLISRNRNISVCINLHSVPVKGTDGYDYFIRTYYISAIYCELVLKDIELEVHRVNKDWMHLKWNYNGVVFEADISLFL